MFINNIQIMIDYVSRYCGVLKILNEPQIKPEDSAYKLALAVMLVNLVAKYGINVATDSRKEMRHAIFLALTIDQPDSTDYQQLRYQHLENDVMRYVCVNV